MSRWENFWRVGVQATVVDVEGEANSACKAEILSRCADSRVGKEESHCDQSANDHSVTSSEPSLVAHKTRQHRAKDAADAGDHVVSPRVVWTVLSRTGAAARQVLGKEDVEKRVCVVCLNTSLLQRWD